MFVSSLILFVRLSSVDIPGMHFFFFFSKGKHGRRSGSLRERRSKRTERIAGKANCNQDVIYERRVEKETKEKVRGGGGRR